jgi:hypothetical protein
MTRFEEKKFATYSFRLTQLFRQPVPYPLLCGQSSFNSVWLFRPSDYLTLQGFLQIRPYEISGPH